MLDFNQLPTVALDFMNKDHQEVVDIYNQVERDYKLLDVDSVIAGILQIQEHCIQHFAHEELEMKTYDFPPYQVHKQEHDRVLMDIDMVVKQLQNHRMLSKISGYIEHAFPSWFSHHLATMDKMTAEFIAGQKIAQHN
jgi:hemerythrin